RESRVVLGKGVNESEIVFDVGIVVAAGVVVAQLGKLTRESLQGLVGRFASCSLIIGANENDHSDQRTTDTRCREDVGEVTVDRTGMGEYQDKDENKSGNEANRPRTLAQ